MGGDEFVCGFSATDAGAAGHRVAEIHAALAESNPEATVTAGIAELLPEDTVDDLIARSDADLYRNKQKARH